MTANHSAAEIAPFFATKRKRKKKKEKRKKKEMKKEKERKIVRPSMKKKNVIE